MSYMPDLYRCLHLGLPVHKNKDGEGLSTMQVVDKNDCVTGYDVTSKSHRVRYENTDGAHNNVC